MKDLNKCQFIGRLGQDAIMKFTPSGAAVTTFSLAVGRQWKDADGTKHEETEWVSCVAWQKLAEICNDYLSKGSRIYVEGRLQTRSWEDSKTGEKRYKTEVILSDMIIIDSRREETVQPAPAKVAPRSRLVLEEVDLPDEVPF